MGIRVLETLSTLAIRVLILFAALAIMGETAFAQDQKDLWETTSINENYLKDLVNTKRCYASENNFLGCIAAINSLLATSTPTLVLSNKKIDSLPNMKDIVKTVERVKIRSFETTEIDNKNIAQSWDQTKKNRAIINQSWKEIYTLTKNSPISIETLLSTAFNYTSTTAAKSKLADAVNAFYESAFDPHTYITPTAKWEQSVARSEQRSVGAGIYIQTFNNQFVLKPMENGSAMNSGIKDLDVLTHVDGESVSAMNKEEVIRRIGGAENTVVTLTVLRKGKSLDIKVPRTIYTVKNIDSKLLTDPLSNKKIGYIKLSSFMEQGVCKKFVALAIDLQKQGAENLILDLRNNGGGLLQEALCMASMYIDKGKLILTENDPQTNKVQKPFVSIGNAALYRLFKNRPLFILQNGYSASASEALAGSLSAYGRAITIGERSFGKGTVQEAQNSIVDTVTGVRMMKTISRFHFASGASNQIVGIQPDVLAYVKPNPTADEKFTLREIDNYPNAIISSKTPTPFASFAIEAIKKCILKRNLQSTEYGNSIVGLDYQLLTAREVASCQFASH